MIDKNGTILRNLEDQVQYLTDLNEWASLGFKIAGKMVSTDTLPAADTLANGTTYIVGVKAPYHFWAAVNGGWIDLGEFPRKGDPGAIGATGSMGPQGPIGPQGAIGPTGATGKAGKNGDGLGVENITDINLATGTQSVSYDSTNGATVTAQGKIVAAGQDYPVTVSDKIPLVAGENVTITTENNKLKVNAKQAVKSVNGKVGHVELTIPTKTSDLVNDAEFITPSYHDNTKQNTLISGDNIKTINNESILGPGNINISGGGGGGTDTGFGNVRRIEYVDHGMGYYPDTQEYLVSSGTMGVYLNGSENPINIETVQSFGIMPGNNVTFTEEQIGDEWKLKINATGGGSTTPKTNSFFKYNGVVEASPTVGSTYSYDDSKTDYTNTGCSYVQGQMVIDNNGVIYKVIGSTMCDCEYIPTIGSSNVQQTNGFYQYNAAVTASPTAGSNYSYSNSKILYPSGCSYFYGQMIIDTNGAIYRVMGAEMCKCVYAPQGGGSSGSATLYQHTITYNSDHFASDEAFSNEVSGSFSISFYSTHGHFEDASAFWAWLIGRGSIDTPGGHMWGSMGGDTAFDRITVLGNTDAEKYIKFESFGGYGEWTAQQYLKNAAATGLTDTITDGFRDM